MKVAILIVRILLGLVFVVLGWNPFLYSSPQCSLRGRPILDGADRVALRTFRVCHSGCGWCPVAGESVRSPCTDAARTRNRQHPAVSPAFGPCWSTDRAYRCNFVGHPVLSSPPILLRPFFAANFIADCGDSQPRISASN